MKSELGRRMRVVKEDGVEGWSWAKEIRGHFGNMSPGMRGEFVLFPSTSCVFGRRRELAFLQASCPPTTAEVTVEDVVFCADREQDHIRPRIAQCTTSKAVKHDHWAATQNLPLSTSILVVACKPRLMKQR